MDENVYYFYNSVDDSEGFIVILSLYSMVVDEKDVGKPYDQIILLGKL